jgi:hypothetical protein
MKPELGPWKSQSSRKLTSRLPDCADAAGTNAVITKTAAATVRMNDGLVEAPWSDTFESPLFSRIEEPSDAAQRTYAAIDQ